MTPSAQERAEWEFVVWSEEGQGRYSVCLHRGDLGSPDHLCLGEAISKDSAAHTVHHANVWLSQYRADAVAQAVQAEREACAKTAEGFESPFSQEFPAEAWRGKLQTVILQAMLSAPKDGDDTQPERAITEAVFAFLQTGRDGMDELFKTGNASAAIRARSPEPAGEKG